MAISLKCKCGATLTVTAAMAGKLGTCPRCGKTMRIPKEVASAAAVKPEAAGQAAVEGTSSIAPPAREADARAVAPLPATPEVKGRLPVSEPRIEPPQTEPLAQESESAKQAAAEAVSEAASAEVEPAEEAPVYPINMRWPTSRVPLVLAAAGVLVIAAVILLSIYLLPEIERQREQRERGATEQVQLEKYVNPAYNYMLKIPPEWARVETGTPDKVLLKSKSGPSEIIFEVRAGAEKLDDELKALSDEAGKEPGFHEENWWGNDSASNGKPWQYVYLFDKDGDRWRAVLRTFKLRDKWMVVTFRAPLANYQKNNKEFEGIYGAAELQ